MNAELAASRSKVPTYALAIAAPRIKPCDLSILSRGQIELSFNYRLSRSPCSWFALDTVRTSGVKTRDAWLAPESLHGHFASLELHGQSVTGAPLTLFL
jgi:hypothetical protein